MEVLPFLQPTTREIRKSIKDIDDSYNNDWDILAELLQNSVDAIKKQKPPNPEITLEVDSLMKNITIQDNGNGINRDDLPSLLAPFSSNKEDDAETIGEKGVGLTFVIFSCKSFYIKTGNATGTTIGQIDNAVLWKNSQSDDPLYLNIKHSDETFTGTVIKLINIKEDNAIFSLTFDQLKFVLRTKSALGNTNCIWGDEEVNIHIVFKFKNQDGEDFTCTLPNRYQLIYEGLRESSKIDLNDFIAFAKNPARTDREKRRKLENKIIYTKGNFPYHGRTIKYVTCFVPNRSVWNLLSVDNNLCTEEQIENSEWSDEHYYSIFSEGIYTSVKGMPTGITVERPTTGFSGYWSNIFILFEDRQLKFDIGRKSIHGMIAKIYKNLSKTIFNNYLQYIAKFVSGAVATTDNSEWNKDVIFAEIDHLIPLNSPKSKFKKSPKDQEAGVSAIFYECIGNGLIKNITPLVAGYKNKYDLYAKWGDRKIVFEIKSRLKNILRDFSDESKMFDEINCIVCWDVSDEDRQAMQDRGISLDEIEEPDVLSPELNNIIPNSTHELRLPYTSPIFVIDLKKIIG